MPIVIANPASGVNGNDSFTRMLVHSDTTNGSTTAVDSSVGGANSPHTMNMANGAQHSTTRAKFGASSMRVASGTQHVNSPDNIDWTLGTSDFAIDTWVNFNSLNAGSNEIASHWHSGSVVDASWNFFTHDTDGYIGFAYTLDGDGNGGAPNHYRYETGNGTFNANLNQWYHLAVARDGANLRIFVDGTQIGTTYNIGAHNIFNCAEPFRIGAVGVNGGIWTPNTPDCYFDEFRYSVGTPRYTGNFTPETAPYTP